jgi:hypothetical protein
VATVTLIVISAWTSSTKQPVKTQPARVAATAGKRSHAAAPGLAITAVRGPSFVAVHRGGASGPVVFQGTVGRGHTEPFVGRRFWVNVSSPENLVVKVRGRRIPLGGYRPRVITVTPSAWHVG